MTASAKSWESYEYIVSHTTSLQNQKKKKKTRKKKKIQGTPEELQLIFLPQINVF